jgi:3',5'-cyclic AMP phosphodiesterase CpdA
VTPTSITVMWETTGVIVGTVEFGEHDRFDREATDSRPRTIHEVHLTGLDPATTYTYRVRFGDQVLSPASFTTAPPPGTENWRMVVYGDNRSNPDTHARNVEQIMKLDPGLVINSGDLVAAGSRYEQWKTQYFDPLRGLAEHVALFPCLGNHEQNAAHYYNYHSLPDDQGEVYYSFDYANAHFIALNSNAQDAPFQLGDPQTEWLIADLEAHRDATWTFVFFHHPLFRAHATRGITPQRWVWQPIFDEYGVDLVISGHDHYYMRSHAIGDYRGEPRRGVYHLISGGGGAPTYPMTPKVHAAARQRTHHVTAIDITGNRLVGRGIDLDGNEFDTFVIDQHLVNPPDEFVAYEIFELERDLRAAVLELPVVEVEVDDRVDIDETVRVPNPFDVPLQTTVTWRETDGWAVPPPETAVLAPGSMLEIPVRARFTGADIYPLPTVMLEFRAPDGRQVFRNDTVRVEPLRLRRAQTVRAPRITGVPRVDGVFDFTEPGWNGAMRLDPLVSVQGDALATPRVEARLAHRDGWLYVAARMGAQPGVVEHGATGRDNRRALSDDNLRVVLAVNEQVYMFIVSAGGAVLDFRLATDASRPGLPRRMLLNWNSGFTAATTRTADGWQAELAIPVAQLWGENAALRLNVARHDLTPNSALCVTPGFVCDLVNIAELAPTFGASNLDHRIPMYGSDPTAIDRFARLVLQ